MSARPAPPVAPRTTLSSEAMTIDQNTVCEVNHVPEDIGTMFAMQLQFWIRR